MTPEMIEVLVATKKEMLRTIYANETPQRTHVRVHCPACGDSTKTPNGTHCYVNIEGGKPISWYCQLCNEGGWVGSTFLRSLNINSLDVIVGVRKYNDVFRKERGMDNENWRKAKHDIINAGSRSIVPVYTRRLQDYEFKMDYLSGRLGVNIGYYDIPKLKIVLSLHDFLKTNALRLNKVMMRDAEILEKQYVGFLSMQGDYIVFRNTKKDKHNRYINYPIFEKNSDATKSYILPTSVDLMSDDITLNVTEGVMDLLGCYYHINHQNTDNIIYGAVNGSGFIRFVKRILHMGFIDNLNINVYSDKDKGIGYHKKLKTLSDEYKSLSIYYNHFPNEKDIGVRAEKIDVRKIKMLF